MPICQSKTPTKDGRKFFYKVSYKDAFGNSKTVVSKKFFTKTEAKKTTTTKKTEAKKPIAKKQTTKKTEEK